MVIACCCDDSAACLVVNLCAKEAEHSDHSSTWYVQSSMRSVWLMHEALNCLAWKWDGDKVLVIAM